MVKSRAEEFTTEDTEGTEKIRTNWPLGICNSSWTFQIINSHMTCLFSVSSVSSVVNLFFAAGDSTRPCGAGLRRSRPSVRIPAVCGPARCRPGFRGRRRPGCGRRSARSSFPSARLMPATSSSKSNDSPQATLIVRPTASGASAASRLPCTMLSMYVKSRDCLPSPKIVGRWPASISRDELRNHGRVLAFWILPRAEHVEVADRDGFQAVGGGERLAIQFAGQLRGGVGRQRRRQQSFVLRRRRLIAVRAAGAAEHDAPHAALPGHVEQLHRAGDARGVRVQRRVHAPRHRGQRRLVKHDFDTVERPLDVAAVHEVAFDEFDATAQVGPDSRDGPCSDYRTRARALPRSTSAVARCEPMKPAPPVTR